MLPFADRTVKDTYIFQQQNAATHRSNYSQDYLSLDDSYKLPGSANSLELNLFERIRDILTRAISHNQGQLLSMQDLFSEC